MTAADLRAVTTPGQEAALPSPTIEGRVSEAAAAGWDAFTGRTLGARQAAVVRMGIATVFGAYLIREWPNRRVLYGDRSPWSLELARRFTGADHAFTVLTWSGRPWWFELCYTAAIVISVLMVLGWRTRAVSVLFMLAVLSVQNRNPLMGDGGDNVVHIMAVYLAFTRCGQVWSLDARRRQRHIASGAAEHDRVSIALWLVLGLLLLGAQASGFAAAGMLDFGPVPGLPLNGWATVLWAFWGFAALHYSIGRHPAAAQWRSVLDALANMLHNCAMLVIAVEVCLIYSVAGWYKIQGSLWARGTAVYFPLHLNYFTPWPSLSHLLARGVLPVFAITYGTVIGQVAFPFLLLNRRAKYLILPLMMAEHATIAVLLGLPFFSLAMIAADSVFLPTGLLLLVERRLAARARRTP